MDGWVDGWTDGWVEQTARLNRTLCALSGRCKVRTKCLYGNHPYKWMPG